MDEFVAKSTITSTSTALSDWIRIRADFNVSISGTTWTATVSLQRRFSSAGTTLFVDSYTANAQEAGFEPEDNVWYRIGQTAHTSGKPGCRVSQ